jgi:hypothetical protein
MIQVEEKASERIVWDEDTKVLHDRTIQLGLAHNNLISHCVSNIMRAFSRFFMAMVLPTCHVAGTSLLDPVSSASRSFSRFLADYEADYTNKVFLGPDNDIALLWKINGDHIELAVAAGASGWVGFGIADAGAMPGADMITFEAATQTLTDRYSLEFAKPIPDLCQDDWTLVGSDSDDNFISFRATRALVTNDPQDRNLIDDSDLVVQATPVIVAWGNQQTLSFHGLNRARSYVRFFAEDQESTSDKLEDLSDGSFVIAIDSFLVPQQETTYKDFCIDVPDIVGYPEGTTEAIHIIGVDYASSKENSGIDTSAHVHHFAAFGRSVTCGPQSPEQIFYGWAPGQEPLVMPSNVGIPIGGDTGFQSLALQIHFDNRGETPDVIDSTGIRVYYVLQQREHSAAAMVVGDGAISLAGQSVGSIETAHEFTCPTSCTASHFSAPVTIFAEALHEHETGARAENFVIRQGEIINHAAVDVWDFRRNGIKIVQQAPYELMPGDVFKTVCYYKNRDNATVFGMGSEDEMCQAMLWYYPAISQSHGFCAPNFPDPQCSADYNPYNPGVDFGRFFGTPKEGGCPEVPVDDSSVSVKHWVSIILALVTGFIAA